jgi:hypothetical protein
MLLLSHIVPALPLPGMEAALFGRAGDIHGRPRRAGVDGGVVSLPASSARIERSRRD